LILDNPFSNHQFSIWHSILIPYVHMILGIVIAYIIQISVLHTITESGKFLWRTSGSFRDNFAYDFIIMETLLRKNVESI